MNYGNRYHRACPDRRQVKEEAAHVLEQMGLSVSDAIRLLMVRIAREKALPFDVKVPNDETVGAMEEARRGEGKRYSSVAEMMNALNADDPAD